MDHLLPTIQNLLSQPTAPFHEDAVCRAIRQMLQECPSVRIEQDDFGNLIATYQRGDAKPRWAFAAHMDHPGWVRSSGAMEAEGEPWQFLGGVPKDYLAPKPPRVEFGAFAMWDLPAFELKEGKIYSRACDDLIGCAAIVAMFKELERTAAECCCMGLFTRAEEVGFVGAMRLAMAGRLAKDVAIISLETSAERPPAKMGDGVIVRVGDKASIFDPAITAELVAAASAEKLPFQRCLMPGGTCEATAYALYGYQCGALCVALGNYHNCGPETRIAPEYVALADVEGLAALCVTLARGIRQSGDPIQALKLRLEENLTKHEKFFRQLDA